jgi:ribosomal protein S18 acetylase RimI-like enzyme
MADSLFFEFASPIDPDLAQFESGDPEVDEYFSSKRWFDKGKHKPATYQFRTLDKSAVVGYAAADFRNLPHPDEESSQKARYLVIYVVGIYKHLQGEVNPSGAAGERFATSIFNALEGLAREKPNTVGLYLRVRSGNTRAVSFYKRFGFTVVGSPFQAANDNGDPYLLMRKPLD